MKSSANSVIFRVYPGIGCDTPLKPLRRGEGGLAAVPPLQIAPASGISPAGDFVGDPSIFFLGVVGTFRV